MSATVHLENAPRSRLSSYTTRWNPDSVTRDDIEPVPAPATWLLLAAGLISLPALGWWRRANSSRTLEPLRF